MPAGRRGGVILVNPGISGVFLKTGPGTPLGVASLNLNMIDGKSNVTQLTWLFGRVMLDLQFWVTAQKVK